MTGQRSLCGLVLLLCACDPGALSAQQQRVDAPPCASGSDCASGVCGLAPTPPGVLADADDGGSPDAGGDGGSPDAGPDGGGPVRRCVPEADLIYVRHGGTCGTGSLADPMCSYPFGRDRAVLRLLPGTQPPERLVVGRDGTDWTVYADGTAALRGVLVQTSAPARLTLVGGRALGVRCEGAWGRPGVALTLEDVEVTGSAGVAVDSTDCEVRLHGALVRFNRGGVRLRGGTYEILNSTIEDNTSTANPGVYLASDTMPVGGDDRAAFQGNLVRRNSAGAFSGGVDCGGGRPRVLGPTALCGNSERDGRQAPKDCTFSELLPCPREESP